MENKKQLENGIESKIPINNTQELRPIPLTQHAKDVWGHSLNNEDIITYH